MADRDTLAGADVTWYEFRVWGRHRTARKRLEALATETSDEVVDDWYLLSEDVDVNAKIRGDKVKLKRLVGERKGFEHWVSERFAEAEDAPEPFNEVIDEIPLGSRRKLPKALRRLDPELGVRPVQVRKQRRHYRIGTARAEVTEIVVIETDTRLQSLVIEGPDLDELVALRKALGLRGEPNVAVHQVIDDVI